MMSRPGDVVRPSIADMPSPTSPAGPQPRTGSVAVLTIRALDELAGGAGRYRISSCAAVGVLPEERRVVLGADALRAELCRFLGRVIEATNPPERS